MDVHQEIEALRQRIAELERGAPQDRLCLCVFSGELDRVLAALVIATGAAASGMEVCVFFTFWGTSALRDPRKRVPKGTLGHMFGAFLPLGTRKLKLSQMHFLGMGRALIRRVMRQQNVASVDELIDLAGQLGVRFMICSMSMELMSLSREEMIDYPHLETCGVASFVELSASAKSTLFV
jgi:peroxiredoxin family protein